MVLVYVTFEVVISHFIINLFGLRPIIYIYI